ncbi:hypothetical protein GCM10010430_70030 [Kitasatospora cystarginea]|uniref:Agmatine deiminase n=1 Tax=Kitasatospora cystarginea TaxID=58350 RepID=A0ABP5RSQ4_9ACTN
MVQRPATALAAAVLGRYGIERVRMSVVAEGGSFETDGQGTLLVTESSVVNQRRNPGKSRDEIEAELKKALGVTKVIWFAGVRDQDMTDAHVDCLVRFAAPGVVLLDQPFSGAPADVWSRSAAQAREVLKSATDAHGRGERMPYLASDRASLSVRPSVRTPRRLLRSSHERSRRRNAG